MNEPKPKWVSEPNQVGWWVVRRKIQRDRPDLWNTYYFDLLDSGGYGCAEFWPEDALSDLEFTDVTRMIELISKRQIDGEKINEDY